MSDQEILFLLLLLLYGYVPLPLTPVSLLLPPPEPAGGRLVLNLVCSDASVPHIPLIYILSLDYTSTVYTTTSNPI